MYRVLIVDDEKAGRMGIAFLLRQQGQEFEIVECTNGLQALQALQTSSFDFLLTDIKMPVMNGLELLSHAVKMAPDMACVILSGYSDFEYAREAIKMGVCEYILKPVDPVEFSALMERLVSKKEEKERQETQRRLQCRQLEKYQLYTLLSSADAKMPERDRASLAHYRYMVLLQIPESFFSRFDDFESELQKLLPQDCLYLNLDMEEALLFFQQPDISKAARAVADVQEWIWQTWKKQAYVSALSSIDSPSDIYRLYCSLEDTRLLEQALELEGLQGSTSYVALMESQLAAMEGFLRQKDLKGFRNSLQTFCLLPIADRGHLSAYAKYLLYQIVRMLQKQMESQGLEAMKQVDAYIHAGNTQTMQNILFSMCDALEAKLHAGSSGIVHKEVQAVQKYIVSHYSQDISVDQLAEHVCLAPSYLSHIFKKETGENLGKFIKRVRMEKARDLLENTYEKIITISVAVGYQNVSYFCQSFREYYGISPQRFRNQGEAG